MEKIKQRGILFLIFFIIPFLFFREGRAEGDRSNTVFVSIKLNAAILCDQAYDPPVFTIPVGTTVVWTNDDVVTHTLVSSEGPGSCDGTPMRPEMRPIEGGQIFQRGSYSKTFDKPGTYQYMCHFPMHRMQGTVVVVPK